MPGKDMRDIPKDKSEKPGMFKGHDKAHKTDKDQEGPPSPQPTKHPFGRGCG